MCLEDQNLLDFHQCFTLMATSTFTAKSEGDLPDYLGDSFPPVME